MIAPTTNNAMTTATQDQLTSLDFSDLYLIFDSLHQNIKTTLNPTKKDKLQQLLDRIDAAIASQTIS